MVPGGPSPEPARFACTDGAFCPICADHGWPSAPAICYPAVLCRPFLAMTKYFLLLALALFAWWLWRRVRKPDRTDTPRGREVERMVQCAHCGVNQPVSESLLADGRYYCCAAHLRESGNGGG
ncbi:MAG: hypothetical protein AW12_00029 [Candidatus Accumulibacter sp. BA-94]|nr:MAG: hypothetical protein AW12_00029 [Candidatus Accumulibacter sp. BA-94]